VQSDSLIITGINVPAPISVTGGQYRINSGPWTATAGFISSGATVRVRTTSSPDYETARNVTLTIGGVSDTFTVTTLPFHLKVDLLFPTPGSDIGRGYATTTTVMCRVVDSDTSDLAQVTSITANGVPLAETASGSGIWFAQIAAVAGENSLTIQANVSGEPQALVSTSVFNNQGAINSPSGIEIDPVINSAYVVDGDHDSVVKINLATGHREVIADTQTWTGDVTFWPQKIRLHNNNSKLLITDSWGSGSLFDLDLATSERTLLASPVGSAVDVELNSAGTQALVASGSYQSIYGVDIATGVSTTIASSTVGGGDEMGWPFGITADSTFDTYILASIVPSALLTLDPVTGNRSIIASNTIGSGETLGTLSSVIFQPGDDSIWVGDSHGVIAVDLTTQVRTRPLATNYPVADLAHDSANNRLLLLDSTNGAINTMDTATFAAGTLFSGQIGEGPRFSSANSTAHDATGKYVFVGGQGVIYRVELATGNREVVSGSGVGSGPSLSNVYDISVSPAGQLYVVNLNAVLRVDLATGNRVVVASSSVGTGPAFTGASGLTIDWDSQTAWLVDYNLSAVLQLDLATGDRFILSDTTNGQGPAMGSTFGIALDTLNNRLLVGYSSGIMAVNRSTGDRIILSGVDNTGPAIRSVREISLDSLGNRLLMLSNSATSTRHELLAVDLSSGNRTAISLMGSLGTGVSFLNTQGISVDAENGRVFLVDGGSGTGALVNVSLITGDRVIVSQ
jgi:DNA-binding beta-propeller fold protein YncE